MTDFGHPVILAGQRSCGKRYQVVTRSRFKTDSSTSPCRQAPLVVRISSRTDPVTLSSPHPQQARRDMTKIPQEPRRILIVDDDRKVLDLLVELLEVEGTRESRPVMRQCTGSPDVLRAGSGGERRVMPMLDGIELCRRISKTPGPQISRPAMSGSRQTSDGQHRMMTAGADDYLDIRFDMSPSG